MWTKKVIVLAFVVAFAYAQDNVQEDEGEATQGGPSPQDANVAIRKLRLRRPRPVSIDNVDGIAQGDPVPLRAAVPADNRQNTADLLAATFEESQRSEDALQSLLETAAPAVIEESEPILPLRAQPQRAQEQPRRQQPEGRRRAPPGVPRRSRPRPDDRRRPASSEEEGGNGRPRPEPIKTTERYSHMNADGSFTFGYVSEDGAFREETRGVDCITRGKYGYIDPDGKRREFTYVSGLPCDNDEEQEFDQQGFAIDDNERVREDPVDPADRFRQSNPVQLADNEIPDAARRPVQIRPAQRRPQPRPQPTAGSFANFGAQPQQPARQPRPRVRPTAAAARPAAGGALQNLFNIADGAAAPQPTPTAAVSRPRPTPTRPRPTPTRARPAPTSRPGFDFDSAISGFTLGGPALTFADQGRQEQPRTQDGAPAAANQPVGPNFSSELVFDAASGTFKTELRQTIAGAGEIKISDAAQPGARPQPQTTAGPQTTAAAFSPTPRPTTPRPFTAFVSTTGRPTTAGAPTQFQGLNFPDPSTVITPRPASPSPVSSSAVAPTSPARPPTPTRRPTPTVPASPVTSARPPTSPANSFFFQPFATVGSPRPVAPGQPATPRPPTIIPINPAGTFNLAAARPASPRPPQPPQIPGFPRPTPVIQPRPEQPRASPTAAAAPAPTPQVQFGFQPLRPAQPSAQAQPGARPILLPQIPIPNQAQGSVPRPPQPQARPNVPFTAFRNGLPPAFSGQPRPQQAFQQRPGQFTVFQPRPQGAVQARPPPGFAARPPPQAFQPRPEQFRGAQQGPPGGRFVAQRPGAPPAGFSVFNPALLRGARSLLPFRQ